MKEIMLTTIDNPIDPFEDFDAWLNYDVTVLGYNSSAYLARIAHISSDLTDQENFEAIEAAIDEIIKVDPFGIYMKVVKESNPEDYSIENEEFDLDQGAFEDIKA